MSPVTPTGDLLAWACTAADGRLPVRVLVLLSQGSLTTSGLSLISVAVGLGTELGPPPATFKAGWFFPSLSTFELGCCLVGFRFSGSTGGRTKLFRFSHFGLEGLVGVVHLYFLPL